MEINQAEVNKVTDAIADAQQKNFLDLTELQLAFVGGGVGEVVLA